MISKYFLLIDGLNGGSTDKDHVGWFEIDGFDFDIARATAGGPRQSEDGEGAKADVLQLTARRLAAKALEGDLGTIREIFDRIDGKTVAGTAPEQTPRKVEMQWKE